MQAGVCGANGGIRTHITGGSLRTLTLGGIHSRLRHVGINAGYDSRAGLSSQPLICTTHYAGPANMLERWFVVFRRNRSRPNILHLANTIFLGLEVPLVVLAILADFAGEHARQTNQITNFRDRAMPTGTQ